MSCSALALPDGWTENIKNENTKKSFVLLKMLMAWERKKTIKTWRKKEYRCKYIRKAGLYAAIGVTGKMKKYLCKYETPFRD